MILMEKEAPKPQIAPPRINDIDQVLRELGIGPETPNQAHPTTPKVLLTEEKYTPSKAMKKVENIATLMDVIRDEDFLRRCPNAKMYSFYISSKDIPIELINALERLGLNDPSVYFRIDREKRTFKPVPNDEFNMLNLNERGRLHRSVLKGIRKGGLLYISFSATGWWVGDPAYHVNEGTYQVAFVESID